MTGLKDWKVLIVGASFAGLSAAYWMLELGCEVTVVEVAPGLRIGGTAVDIVGSTVDTMRRMGLLDQIRANRLSVRLLEFKNIEDVTDRQIVFRGVSDEPADDAFEVKRSVLLNIMFEAVIDRSKFAFDTSVASMQEVGDAIDVWFTDGSRQSFELVLGCDGLHSKVRKMWFGDETRYSHFLQQYFSITIVDKLLIERDTVQLFNVPGKSVMLNAYKNNTDIVLGFVSDREIAYDRRDEDAERRLIAEQFAGLGWRTQEMLREVMASKNFYFDKLSQIRMPSWSRGRVALVGDAAHCASPAAGMGGSLAIDGAAVLAEALRAHGTDYRSAFETYDAKLRPFVEEVQARAIKTGLETLVPRTDAAIKARNARTGDDF